MSKKDISSRNMAVALRYDEKSAPRITAKGKGIVADEIIRRAVDSDVPIREQPEVVQLLAKVDIGDEIPESLYIAVAEIIAFAYMIKGKTVTTARRKDDVARTRNNDQIL